MENNIFFLNSKFSDEHNFTYNINQKRINRQTEQEDNEFIKELSNIALNIMKNHSSYGCKLMDVKAIGNVSRVRLQYNIK